MRETTPKTLHVQPPPEIEARIDQFPKAFETLNDWKYILETCGVDSFRIGVNGKTIVDKQVINGIQGGINGMYRELASFGLKDFADKAVSEKR